MVDAVPFLMKSGHGLGPACNSWPPLADLFRNICLRISRFSLHLTSLAARGIQIHQATQPIATALAPPLKICSTTARRIYLPISTSTSSPGSDASKVKVPVEKDEQDPAAKYFN
jgi:hypothetical protein